MEWAIKEALETGKPVVASMCIGPYHDLNGVPTGECAVRMAKAGASLRAVHVVVYILLAGVETTKANTQLCIDAIPYVLCTINSLKCHITYQNYSIRHYRMKPGLQSQLTSFHSSRHAHIHVFQWFLTGASVVGINCNFGPTVSLKSMRSVKEGLDKAGLSPHLIVQPLGYFTPDVENKIGYLHLPETPFGRCNIHV